MDREQLKSILPHRDPMLLLDSVEREGDEARGVLDITGDEWFPSLHRLKKRDAERVLNEIEMLKPEVEL